MSGDGERGIDKVRAKFRTLMVNIVESRWYKWLVLIASLILLARIVDPTTGSVSPSFLARLPNWIFLVCAAAVLPMLFVVLSIQRELTLERYNPEAPEIKKMINRWRRIGWAAIATAILAVFLIIFFVDYIAGFPVWLMGSIVFIPIFVGAFALHHAEGIKTGMWSPPEWMPPMNEPESVEESLNEEEEK